MVRVRLDSVDPEAQAAIDMAFYQNPTDMDTMISGIELAHRIAQQSELKSWGNQLLSKAAKSKNRKTLEKWIGKGTVTVFHYAGTCSMGDGDDAPVDRELRVKGLRNVRVADASVIPDIPVSALNAPSMMIGYRAADFIINAQ